MNTIFPLGGIRIVCAFFFFFSACDLNQNNEQEVTREMQVSHGLLGIHSQESVQIHTISCPL